MKVSINGQADHELTEGALFYARKANKFIAEAFLSEFERSAKLLLEHPKLGTPWRGQVRLLPLRRFPYSVVYYLRDSEIRVLALAHQRRRPGFWRGRS